MEVSSSVSGSQEINPHYFDVIFKETILSCQYPQTFAIITAWNPKDVILPEQENEKRNRSLEKSIKKPMVLSSRIIGASADLQHQEVSLIIEGELPDLINLAQKFEQNAIFWVQGDSLELIACDTLKHFMLGSFRERIRQSTMQSN
jgi:hypothetical protein